jgi:hypothetical protein
MKREVEQTNLHRIAKVSDCVEMWQGSQELHATLKKSRAKNMQMNVVLYISDTEAIITASLSKIQNDGVTALKLSE